MTISPHLIFEVVTPDQVAECWDGVFKNELVPNLYEQLWDRIEDYGKVENMEDIGPADLIGVNSVKRFWDKFTPEAQMELNRLADLNNPYQD